jgi:antibiotic biosynthesis monooxygenase (ABM) superfamily enzyme
METDAPRFVTAVVTVKVRQGEERAFAGWLTEMNKTVATFAGYITAVVIPPVPPLQADWVMVQRFRTLEQLGAWLDSNARRSLLARSTSLFPKRTRSPLVGSQKKTKVSNRVAIRELTHTDSSREPGSEMWSG